jgi:hypothetical protein
MTSEIADNIEPANLLKEYEALRWEVVHRVVARSQIVLATLTLAGLIFGFGLGTAAVAFVFPIIATFLATAWIQHDARTREITTYIRERLEPKLPGMGWEAYRLQRTHRATRLGGMRLSVLSAGGVFFATQIVALVIGFSRFATFTPAEWVFGLIAVVFTAFTLFLLADLRKIRS